MRRRFLWLPFGLFIALPALVSLAWAEGNEPSAPALDKLRAHVATLASPEFQGRRGTGGQKAADYLVDVFQQLRLEPPFKGSFTQTIPGKDGEPPLGRNVGAMLRGSDPRLRDEWLIVSAHFDHLGMRNGVLFPGADDNASGVAMMLEVARGFAERTVPPRRSLLFVGFDLEEDGLFGSRYFVEHMPIPLARVGLFVTADMIARSLGGVCEPYVFVMGSEHAPALRPWVVDAAKGLPVTVGLLGSDLLLLDRSDYGPFRSRSIPYLFFSTGENPFYHTSKDTPETLNYPKLEAISQVIFRTLETAADAETLPTWSRAADNPIAEAKTLRDVLRTLLDHREVLKINNAQAFLMTNSIRTLDAILKRGSITPEERAGVVRVIRVILLSVF